MSAAFGVGAVTARAEESITSAATTMSFAPGTVRDGNGQGGFFVQGGSLTLENVTLQGYNTRGSDGSGGGAGMGGALFINAGATATLSNVNFLNNAVTGGNATSAKTIGGSLNGRFDNTGTFGTTGTNGADASPGAAFVNGGNGLGGFGASSGGNGTGNGHGGKGGDGGTGSFGTGITADTVKAGADIAYQAVTSGNDGSLETAFTALAAASTTGAAATITEVGHATAFTAFATAFTTLASTAGPAKLTGDAIKTLADSAYLIAITITNVTLGTTGNGGNGGGGNSGGNGDDFAGGGEGGKGGQGGDAIPALGGRGGTGGNGGDGGIGGFGAGGGRGGDAGDPGATGGLNFDSASKGAGGGGGTAGFGGGTGRKGNGVSSISSGGQGGSAFGGAIFVRAGGSLNITGNALFLGNQLNEGNGEPNSATANSGISGFEAGNDLFMMKGSTVVLAPGGSNVITFNGSIADDSAQSLGSTKDGTNIPSGQGAGLTVQDGLVIFNGVNTYTGQTKIAAGGVLQAQDNSGISYNSNINLAGGTLQGHGDFTRFLGTAPRYVQWTGDGGFSAVGGDLTVNLAGGATQVWNANSFVPTGNALLFGSTTATNKVLFKNSIDLNGADRSILVKANLANPDAAVLENIDAATLSGVLSNGSLSINDANHTGTLVLSGNSTYTGSTTLNAGKLSLTGSLASNAIAVATGATLDDINGGLAAGASLTNNGTLLLGTNETVASLTNTGTINGANTLTAATYALNDGSVVNSNLGAGAVIDNGTVALNGTSAASTFRVQTGVTTLGSAERLLDTVALTVDPNARINLGGNEKIGSLFGGGVLDNKGFTLTVNSGNFTGDITGAGGLTKLTSAELTLLGANTFTGPLVITEGTINLGATGSLATPTVATQAGTVFVPRPGSTVAAPNLVVQGTMVLADSSVLSYETISGNGIVDLAGSTFTNLPGRTLSGYLTFINGTFLNLGTISPGNSPGLITQAGNLIEGALEKAELETTTAITGHDQIRVSGTATLLPTSSLGVATFNNVLPVRGATFQFIADANGGAKTINGAYGSVTFDADGIAGAGAPVSNAASVFDQATGQIIATGLNNANSTFADLGLNANQRAAATALFNNAQSFVGPNQINTTTGAGLLARQTIVANGGSSLNFARFTPEYFGAMSDFANSHDVAITSLLNDRVSVLTNLPGTEAQGLSMFGGRLQRNLDTADAVKTDRADVYVGGDYPVTRDVTVGLVAADTTGDLNARFGRGSVSGTTVNAYARAKLNAKTNLVGRVGYGTYTFNTARETTDTMLANGRTDGNSFTSSIGVNYGHSLREFTIVPRADLTYSHGSIQGFTETGANDRLTLSDYGADRLVAQLGASLLWNKKLGHHDFSFELNGGAYHNLTDDKDSQAATVVIAPGTTFNQTFAKDNQTRVNYGARLGFGLSKTTAIFATYQGRSTSSDSEVTNAGLRMSF